MKKFNRIFIVGQLGSGKGMLAKALADKLNLKMIDLDFGLERHIGKPINAILGVDGTSSFLNCQNEIIKSLNNKSNAVINTDASVVDNEANRNLLKSELVIFLDVSMPIQLERMTGNPHPLIDDESFINLLELLHQQRDGLYEDISDYIVNSDDSELEKHVELIINFVSNKLNFENLPSHENSNNLNTIIFHKKTHKPINLTTQQAHCIKLLADGKSAKEIAREINISHRTVEGHLATAMETTGCANSKELIALYLS